MFLRKWEETFTTEGTEFTEKISVCFCGLCGEIAPVGAPLRRVESSRKPKYAEKCDFHD